MSSRHHSSSASRRLSPAAQRGYLTVPQPFERLRPLATRVTAGQSTAYGKAVALQQWFTGRGTSSTR